MKINTHKIDSGLTDLIFKIPHPPETPINSSTISNYVIEVLSRIKGVCLYNVESKEGKIILSVSGENLSYSPMEASFQDTDNPSFGSNSLNSYILKKAKKESKLQKILETIINDTKIKESEISLLRLCYAECRIGENKWIQNKDILNIGKNGEPTSNRTTNFIRCKREKLIEIKDPGKNKPKSYQITEKGRNHVRALIEKYEDSS